eukprot:11170571-Lingulodinium_polyedra.AAC.1
MPGVTPLHPCLNDSIATTCLKQRPCLGCCLEHVPVNKCPVERTTWAIRIGKWQSKTCQTMQTVMQ